MTEPGHGFSPLEAAGLETLKTAALILMIFFMTSSAGTARWSPLGNWLLVASLVWQGAPYSGTSLNPARSVAPCATGPRAEASVGSTSPDRSARDAGCGCVCRVSQYDHADRQALPRPALPRYVGRSASDRGFRGRVHLTSGVVVQPRRHTPGT